MDNNTHQPPEGLLPRCYRHHGREMINSLNLGKVQYNCSFPITFLTEVFDLIKTDTHPIYADLEKVCLGWDPRAMLCLWQEMERRFEFHRSRPVEFHYMITAPTQVFPTHEEKRHIRPCTDVDRFLQDEQKLWLSRWEPGGFFKMSCCRDVKITDIAKSLERFPFTMVGFWSFSLKTLGNPASKFEEIDWSWKKVMDSRKFWG